MIIVNIATYGDFDMPSTEVTMVAPQDISKSRAKQFKREAEEMFKDTDDVDEVIKYLKAQGFETCNSLTITIGGNL